jgi:hypothetical protein
MEAMDMNNVNRDASAQHEEDEPSLHDKQLWWEQIKRYFLGLDCESEFVAEGQAEAAFWDSVASRVYELERQASEATQGCRGGGDCGVTLCKSCRDKLEAICAHAPL